MKDSGVEWIEEIPDNWSIIPMKSMFSYSKGLPITKAVLVEKGIPVISYGQIHSKKNTGIRIENEFIRYAPIEYRNTNPLSQANEGDILFADTSEDYDGIGNCIRVDREQEMYAGYHTIIARPKESRFSKYWAFLFQTDSWRSQLRLQASGIKVFSITQKILNGVSVIIPSLKDGTRIADYLDAKCAKIDALIAKQQEIIEKLKAYKLSVITEAVTKGLNPTVPMKDSEIEWCRCVPESWRRVKLKDICTFHNGDRSSNYPSPEDYVEEGIPFVGADSLWGDYVDTTISKHISAEKYAQMGGLKIRENDVLYTLRGSTIGKNAIAGFNEGTVASSLMGIRAKAMVNASFLYYWLNSNGEYMQRDMCINGSTAPNLSAEDVKLFVLYLPSTQEQLDIVS